MVRMTFPRSAAIGLAAASLSACSLLLADDFSGDAPAPAPDADTPTETGGSPADAGADVQGDADASSGCASTEGPAMVEAGAVCIDSTEVTVAQYARFLDADAGLALQPAGCAWNTSMTPTPWPLAPGSEQLPVTGVNWCQAYAFCAWAGKHLCGSVSGGALHPDLGNDPRYDAWYHACSANGERTYPYGSTYSPSACSATIVPVASSPECVGPVPGLYDMSGNAGEWLDSCFAATGPDDICIARAATNEPDNGACTGGTAPPRNGAFSYIGIRCCRP